MAVLTRAQRRKLATNDFALPGRRYPIHDIAHARNALSRVSQYGSSAEQAAVRRKVYNRYPHLRKGKVV